MGVLKVYNLDSNAVKNAGESSLAHSQSVLWPSFLSNPETLYPSSLYQATAACVGMSIATCFYLALPKTCERLVDISRTQELNQMLSCRPP